MVHADNKDQVSVKKQLLFPSFDLGMVEDKDPVDDGNSFNGECVGYAIDAAVDVSLFVDLAYAVVVNALVET